MEGEMDLYAHWLRMCTALQMHATRRQQELMWRSLESCYREPHRFYHTSLHLQECLELLQSLDGGGVEEDPGLHFALFYHDAIYDTTRRDSEERSALLARNAQLYLGVEVSNLDGLILATRHGIISTDSRERLVVDVDLAILGAPRGRYEGYMKQIRREYGWLLEENPEAFRQGRKAVLDRFLTRARTGELFHHPELRWVHEPRARDNIIFELKTL